MTINVSPLGEKKREDYQSWGKGRLPTGSSAKDSAINNSVLWDA